MRVQDVNAMFQGPMIQRRRPMQGNRVAASRLASGHRPDFLRVALFALMVITVSRIHQHFGFVAAARPALLLAVLCLGYAILNPRSLGRTIWFRTWPARVLLGLGVTACLSAVFGISLGASARAILEDFSKVLIFAFLLMATIRDTRDLRAYVWAYVVAAGVLVWLSLFVFGLAKGGPDQLARLDFQYSYDANDVGLVLLVALGLALLTFHTARRGGRVASALIVLGIGVTLARSGSRGALIGLVVALAALLVFANRVSVTSRLTMVVVVIAGLIVASPPGYWQQMETILRPTQDYNWTVQGGRKQVWLRGVSYMNAYPWFGVGISNFPRAEGTISERAKNWTSGDPGIRWSAPHNSFVQAGAELGVPGLILWSALPLGGIVAMRRLRRRLPRSWAVGDPDQRFLYLATDYLPVALSGFAASAFFVSFAFLDPIYILAAFMTGVYVCAQRMLAGQESGQRPAAGKATHRGLRFGTSTHGVIPTRVPGVSTVRGSGSEGRLPDQ